LFSEFLEACSDLPDNAFLLEGSSRFNLALFEAVFAELLRGRHPQQQPALSKLSITTIREIDSDPEFREALKEGTTKPDKVKARLNRAAAILRP